MINMTWNTKVTQLLDEENYTAIIDFYEVEINKNTEDISLYWYLGLAYLLSGQEAEAGTTWLAVFSEGNESMIDAWTKELIEVLETEAQRQLTLKNYQLSWLIRQQILELAPTLVNNLLHLVGLEIMLERYQSNILKELQILELLEQSEPNAVDLNLLLAILKDVLKFPAFESVDFARASVKYHPNKKALIPEINQIANQMAYEERYPLYAIDLNNIFLEYEPENLLHCKQRFWYYTTANRTDEALEVAQEFQQRANTILLKVYASYLLIHLEIIRADWTAVMNLAVKHKELLRDLATEKPLVVPNFLAIEFMIVPYPLFYIQDNPVENRALINEISRLFQNSTRKVLGDQTILKPEKHQPHERLRIGYVAHTLRAHSVGWLSRWLFYYHNRQEFEIRIYLLSQSEQDFTKTWFTANADQVSYFNRDTSALAKQVKADEIDILVDLDSLTLNLTCQVMSYKPAPIQVTWLGLDASGIPAIDYFIADPYVLPDNAQDYYREKIWRLPQTYLAVNGFEIGIPDLRRDTLDIPADAVVYLNIQNAAKRHPHTLDLQMQIIKAVPNSYFLTKGTGDPAVIAKVFTQAAQSHGISLDRLRFLPRTPNEETHRANLAIADIVLDTYPYNGATTTLEVLWLGIPLVTRVGQQFAARNSYAFMMQVGLTEGIAWTDEEYVEWGIKLGTNPELRQQIRTKLRQSRQTSPLWNAQKFTRDMEQAYQQMWAKYVTKQQADADDV